MSIEQIAQAMQEFRNIIPAPTEENLRRVQEIKYEEQMQHEEYLAQQRIEQQRYAEDCDRKEKLKNKYKHL